MPATSATSKHLIGPALLIQIVHKQSKAVAWMQSVSEPRCVLSHLAIAIVKSTIDEQFPQGPHRDSWHQALRLTITRMTEKGTPLVDVSPATLDLYPLYRRHEPLQFHREGHPPESIGQDVRLLIATAESQGLVYTEFDDLYLQQLAALNRVAVQIL
jgi:hypothetical protein